MLRRAVEIGRQQKIMFGVAAAVASSRPGSQQQVPQSMVFEWKEGDAALVKRQHLQTAQQEMFSALHHQLLRSRSMWEKVLLVSVVVEARATGRNAVVMQVSRGGGVTQPSHHLVMLLHIVGLHLSHQESG